MKTWPITIVLISLLAGLAPAQELKANAQFLETVEKPTAFVLNGRRCGAQAPSEGARSAARAAMRMLKAEGLHQVETGLITVPVRFVVIHDGDKGKVSQADLDRQVEVMNTDCKRLQVEFKRTALEYFDVALPGRNKQWFHLRKDSKTEREVKRALGKDQEKQLNLYVAEPADVNEGDILGWSTFPTSLDGDPELDGVVVHHATLPGGLLTPYDAGRTASHECGHWLGLLHTFQDGCEGLGDEVDDTEPHSEFVDFDHNGTRDIFECNVNAPGCVAGHFAPVNNFMNYCPDACMSVFTVGQSERVQVHVRMFRTALVAAAPKVTPEDLRKLTSAAERLRKAGS